MKKANVFSISSVLPRGYAWKWQCEADKKGCKDAFLLYDDCVSDAKKYGYEVDLSVRMVPPAPGGVQPYMPQHRPRGPVCRAWPLEASRPSSRGRAAPRGVQRGRGAPN